MTIPVSFSPICNIGLDKTNTAAKCNILLYSVVLKTYIMKKERKRHTERDREREGEREGYLVSFIGFKNLFEQSFIRLQPILPIYSLHLSIYLCNAFNNVCLSLTMNKSTHINVFTGQK